jgi:hypothetical protein
MARASLFDQPPRPRAEAPDADAQKPRTPRPDDAK